MPKKVSDKQKQDFVNSFLNGLKIEEISELYKFSNQTIINQLKKLLGDEEYIKLKKNNQKNKNCLKNNTKLIQERSKRSNLKVNDEDIIIQNQGNFNLDKYNSDPFFEVIPETSFINLDIQKDITTKPISEYNFPDTVYMLVNKSIELEPKILKDYPEWSFLPEKDLKRLTLEIFADQKIAKKVCSKNQKLIKIPNPQVFLIASNKLKSKGISRIICEESLLAL